MKITEQITNFIKKKTNKVRKILDYDKKYRIEFVKNEKNKTISIFDKNKMILNGEYNFYGIYQPHTKLWVWASSIPGVDFKHIKNINKIKKMDHLFESEINDNKINFYYQLLTQDVLYITNEKMIDWINELLLYLTDDIFYFNPTNSEGNVQFITLSKIKEKHS